MKKPKFPGSPGATELAKIPAQIKILKKNELLVRLYYRGGSYPTLWNSFRAYGPLSTSRFDHHLPPARIQNRQILYAATLGVTATAEFFQQTRIIDRKTRELWLVIFRVTRDIELLDLTDSWPTKAGASMAINSGPRIRAQSWSRDIYDAYPAIEGLWYSSSMYSNKPAVTLYERAASALPPNPDFNRALSDQTLTALLKNASSEINYSIIP
jgi:hypothetical protein